MKSATDGYRLPHDYVSRESNEYYFDQPTDIVYQPHVYALLAFLARRAGSKRIIDVGCGSATKLRPLQHEFELVCIDHQATLDLAKAIVPGAHFVPCDLEKGLPNLPDALLDDALVVCADVIEHLRDPFPLMRSLAELQEKCRFLLLSTPDRDRARGLLDDGPPGNPAHTREWGAGEFGRFLRDCGFSAPLLIGHTINSNVQGAKATTLVVSGRDAQAPKSGRVARVAAVINVYNEIDILEETVTHLAAQGIEAHLVDNWSEDGTFELAQKLLERGLCRNLLRFPERPTGEYEWARLLSHTSSYARSLPVDWVMHYDADEIRLSPWRDVSLNAALAHVSELGYNAVDFTVLDFRFLDDNSDPTPPYETALHRFEFGRRPGHFAQIKAWKQSNEEVDLSSSGGHDASFPSRRVFPLKFLMKHYPLRCRWQAEQKVFRDRSPRIQRERSERGWHTHYESIVQQGSVPGWKAGSLLAWHARMFESEYLVERLSGIGLLDGV